MVFGKTWRHLGSLYRYRYIEGEYMTWKQKQFWHRRSGQWRDTGDMILMEDGNDGQEEE